MKFVAVIPIVTITANGVTVQSAVNVTVNEALQLTCDVKSRPIALVHWEEDGVPTDRGREVKQQEVTVNTTIHGAVINYTCVAQNVVGGKNRSVSNTIIVYVQGEVLMWYRVDLVTQLQLLITNVHNHSM